MTVPTENSKDTFVGDGFSVDLFVSFGARAASEFVVRKQVGVAAAVLLVAGVDYNVVSFTEVSADIQTVAPQTLGAIYTVERIVPLTQIVDLRTQGNFSPAVHEGIADESCYRDQQLAQRIKVLETAGNVGSVVAGDGLYFAATTLHAGAGPGIVVQPDAITLDYAAAAPGTINVAGGATGALAKVARADHNHSVATAAPAALAAGTAASAAGVSTSLARADHVHAAATAAPVNVTKAAAAAGVATTFAASDHKHDVTTAAAIDLTDATNAEGLAASLARSDHTHQHGARGGGTLHAAATGAVAGFMSAADKAKLDGFLIANYVYGLCGNTAVGIGAIVVLPFAILVSRGSPVVYGTTGWTNFAAGVIQISVVVRVTVTVAGTYVLKANLRINGGDVAYGWFAGTLAVGDTGLSFVVGGFNVAPADRYEISIDNGAGSAGAISARAPSVTVIQLVA